VSKILRGKKTNKIRGTENETARDGTQNRNEAMESSANRLGS
jgi:hypothetical protein